MTELMRHITMTNRSMHKNQVMRLEKGLWKTLFLTMLLLAGCETTYTPLGLDAAKGTYPVKPDVDAAAIQRYETGVDPRQFPLILIATSASVRPQVFEFQIRRAFAELGFLKVYTPVEFFALAKSRGIDVSDTSKMEQIVKDFSKGSLPVLYVAVESFAPDISTRQTLLAVTDGRTGVPLLVSRETRIGGSSLDDDTLYSMMNLLRKWVRDGSKATS